MNDEEKLKISLLSFPCRQFLKPLAKIMYQLTTSLNILLIFKFMGFLWGRKWSAWLL